MMKDMGFPHLNINKPRIDSLMQMEDANGRGKNKNVVVW